MRACSERSRPDEPAERSGAEVRRLALVWAGLPASAPRPKLRNSTALPGYSFLADAIRRLGIDDSAILGLP